MVISLNQSFHHGRNCSEKMKLTIKIEPLLCTFSGSLLLPIIVGFDVYGKAIECVLVLFEGSKTDLALIATCWENEFIDDLRKITLYLHTVEQTLDVLFWIRPLKVLTLSEAPIGVPTSLGFKVSLMALFWITEATIDVLSAQGTFSINKKKQRITPLMENERCT